MENKNTELTSKKQLYLFALFLVLYEFTVYAANDMILPGMLNVVHEFDVSVKYVALSLVYYILGNTLLQLFLGPLAERLEKRKLLLIGNIIFIITGILMLFTTNISQFLLIRCLEGLGVAVIAVGYSLIHENFSDKDAVKIISLMGNIAILAPLIGPLIGALIVSYLNWRFVFVLIVALSVITFIFLRKYTPANINKQKTPLIWSNIFYEYLNVLKNSNFKLGIFISSSLIIPTISWIAIAPTMLIDNLKLSYAKYIGFQLIAIGGFSCCSIFMQFITGKLKLTSILKIGTLLVIIGAIINFLSIFTDLELTLYFISIGLFIFGFGAGMCNGIIIRLILREKGYSANYAMSMMVFLQTLIMMLSLSIINRIMLIFNFHTICFSLINSIVGFVVSYFIVVFSKRYKNRNWE